ncbi:unnamed protein product, partial [Caretta caretta]
MLFRTQNHDYDPETETWAQRTWSILKVSIVISQHGFQSDMWVPEPLLLGDESGGAEAKRGCRFARNAGDLKRRTNSGLQIERCIRTNLIKWARFLEGCKNK